MTDDLIPFQYEGKYYTPESISVYTSGRVWARKQKQVLDESDPDSKEFGEWLRSKLLPKGGRAKVDSYGNVYLRGKQVKQIDFNPKWMDPEDHAKDMWTEVIAKLWGSEL